MESKVKFYYTNSFEDLRCVSLKTFFCDFNSYNKQSNSHFHLRLVTFQ